MSGIPEKFQEVAVAVVLIRTNAVAVTRGLAPPSVTATPANHTGAGTWDLTLAEGIPSARCRTQLTVVGGAANANAQLVHVSDTVKRVVTQVGAGGPADGIDFDVAFSQING